MAMRSYWDMSPEKVSRSYRELKQKSGEAYERLVQGRHGGLDAYDAHLEIARNACVGKHVEIDDVLDEPAPPSPAPSSASGLVRPIPPMLAHDLKGDFTKIPADGNWVMEPKFDGWRWQAHVTDAWVAHVSGRNGVRRDGEYPRITQWLLENVSPGTVLDGEMMHPDGKSSFPDKAVLVVFDVLVADGINLMPDPWVGRRMILERLLDAADEGVVRLVPWSEVDQEIFDNWIENGMEGCVAKRKSAPYVPGTRARDRFVKVKPQATTEATVVGWEYGQGASNKDRCGALVVRLVDNGVITTCKYDATPAEADELEDRLIELAHYGLFPSGSPRHPIFKRFRPDLEAAR